MDVGNEISRAAGAKRLTCELGSNVAVVVLDDANLAHAGREIVRGGSRRTYRALRFAREIKSGHINSEPLFRVDSMPYGGVPRSGFGREGVRYAMDEMSEHKLVVVHPGANG